jgi:hypothetical protein
MSKNKAQREANIQAQLACEKGKVVWWEEENNKRGYGKIICKWGKECVIVHAMSNQKEVVRPVRLQQVQCAEVRFDLL